MDSWGELRYLGGSRGGRGCRFGGSDFVRYIEIVVWRLGFLKIAFGTLGGGN
jgi:hypothetical protein